MESPDAYHLCKSCLHSDFTTNSRRLTCLAGDRLPLAKSSEHVCWDVNNWERDEHLGLVGMRERLESLGGTFTIESERGRGTRIIAQLPLDGLPGDHER